VSIHSLSLSESLTFFHMTNLLGRVRFSRINKMHDRVDVTCPIEENLADLGKQSFDFFLLPVEHPGEKPEAVGCNALVHVQLLVTADFFEFGVFRPRVEW
jgi:hypothetical protein